MNALQKTVLASLVAVGMGVVTVPAAAFVIVPDVTTTEIDDVQVNTVGFDLAASGVPAGTALTPAKVHWEQGPSEATSKLIGSIYFDGVAHNCARVLLISYDANSVEIPPRQFSAEECVSDNGYQERPIMDTSGNPYLQGNPLASEVKIRLQTALDVTVGQSWGGVGTKLEVYGPTLSTSDVLISAAKFDFGTGGRAGGTYADPATVTWSVDGANLIKVSTVGTLSLENAANLCGRIRYTYLNKSYPFGLPDTVLGTQYSNTHCANHIPSPGLPNDLQEFRINENPGTAANAFSYPALDNVEIAIEKSSFNQQTHVSNEDWVVVGSPVNVYLPSAP